LEKGDELLYAGGVLKAVIPQAKEAMTRARTRHPEWYRGYAALEAQAVTLLDYSAAGVLGLLQTEDHARAVFTQRFPRLAEETIEKRVADRLSRQELFEQLPSDRHRIGSASTLRRPRFTDLTPPESDV
jgi:hypothetical protein